MISMYETISLLMQLTALMVFMHVNIDNKNNQPPKQG